VESSIGKIRTIILYKEISETPLECVKRFVKSNPEFENIKMGYAGRLDPMAKGLLLILVGDENKNKIKYEKLDKEYVFEVLFGISTDSYDILGIPNQACFKEVPDNFDNQIIKNIQNFIGKQKQNLKEKHGKVY
jgi:tRNA pseudouridine55 synthase